MGVLEHGPACHRHCMGAWAEPRPGDSGAAPGWGWRDNSSQGDVHDKRCLSHSRLGLTPGTPFVLGTLARGRAIRVQQKAFSQNFLLGGSSRDRQTQKPPEPVLLSCPKPVHSHLPPGRLHLGPAAFSIEWVFPGKLPGKQPQVSQKL